MKTTSVVWQLLSATGAAGRHTEERWQDAPVGDPPVADRIAQMVVKRHLEPLVDKYLRFLEAILGSFSFCKVVDLTCWRTNGLF